MPEHLFQLLVTGTVIQGGPGRARQMARIPLAIARAGEAATTQIA